MGIYKKANSNNFMMSKTVRGITYFKSSGTDSKMRARAIYDEWVIELKEQILTGKPARRKEEPIINNSTFSELADKYLEFTSGRQKSYRNTVNFVKTLIKRFNDKLLDSFTAQDIELLQTELLNKAYSVAYPNRLTSVFKRMFAKAADWDLISEDVLKRVRKAKQLKGEKTRLRYLTEEEAERLIFNCERNLKPIVITALNTGMRKSEILKLTWDRVDLKNHIILLDKTKNGERREIPVNDTLYNILSGLTRHLKTDFVFYNPQTLKPYYDTKKSFTSALRKSHILDFRFHDLRHTFASWLIMAGIDLTTVKELLGHKDVKMTLRYSHLAASHINNAVKALDNKDFQKNFTVSLPQGECFKNNVS
ncbi:MAG: site-specific integrase [Deltaproteobacteria bacterium]|nr:site-specific integrase [Deltaproteobacteria bacterium]